MADGVPGTPASDSAPDWSAISHDVLCPLCEYNLRGLTTPRCPECGYTFDWPEVTDQRRDLHPYLFEHHPERNVRSFCQTAVGLWQPQRFWSSLHPTQKSRPRRLIAFWLLGSLLLALISCALVLVPAQIEANEQRCTAYAVLTSGNFVASSSRRLPFMIPEALIVPMLWPWLTYLALMVFQISMRRAKLRNIHVLRCALYSFEPISWAIIFVVGGIIFSFSDQVSDWDSNFLWLINVGVIAGSYRLWKAYRLYLRFDHSFWTVFACQFITVLGILALTAIVDLGLFYRQIVDNPLFSFLLR